MKNLPGEAGEDVRAKSVRSGRIYFSNNSMHSMARALHGLGRKQQMAKVPSENLRKRNSLCRTSESNFLSTTHGIWSCRQKEYCEEESFKDLVFRIDGR